MNNILSITITASKQIKKILSDAPNGADSVVIGIDKSGCSGYSYKLDFGNSSELRNYEIINQDGVKILIDPQDLFLIIRTRKVLVDVVNHFLSSLKNFNYIIKFLNTTEQR